MAHAADGRAIVDALWAGRIRVPAGLQVGIEVKGTWSQVLSTTPPRGLRDWANSAVFDDPVS